MTAHFPGFALHDLPPKSGGDDRMEMYKKIAKYWSVELGDNFSRFSATWMWVNGSYATTVQSLPNAMRAPAFFKSRHGCQ